VSFHCQDILAIARRLDASPPGFFRLGGQRVVEDTLRLCSFPTRLNWGVSAICLSTLPALRRNILVCPILSIVRSWFGQTCCLH
jgi:hypothetical protein